MRFISRFCNHTAKHFTSFNEPRIKAVVAIIAALGLNHPLVNAATIPSNTEDQSSLALTIYNSDLALVKDQRNLSIPKGEHDVEFMGVSGQIKPETALLRSTKHSGSIRVLEQNFDYDLLTPQKLLEKSLGKTIQIATMNPATGSEVIQSAKVLATNNGLIVEIVGKIETNPNGRFIFPSLPDNLRAQPTLTTTVANTQGAKDTYELSYLTTGLSWNADYVAELTSDNTLDLASWVTLSNNSNTAYKNANIQLVAGDVNLVNEQPLVMAMRMKTSANDRIQESLQSEDILEYKLYSLPRKTTLENAQTKQVSLFNAAAVASHQQLVFRPVIIQRYNILKDQNEKLKSTFELKIKNDKKSNLGLPLPKGTVRVYRRDAKGNAQFVGEDQIDHSAENETITLTLGQSFDVSVERKATNFKIISEGNNQFEFETSYQITFNNAKSSPASVKLLEQFDGEWKITESSAPYTKFNASSAEWNLILPAKTMTTLTFSAKVKKN
jgi:hypothetical protein